MISYVIWDKNGKHEKDWREEDRCGRGEILRWIPGVTRQDRIRTDYIRGSTKVVEIFRKVHEGRLI